MQISWGVISQKADITSGHEGLHDHTLGVSFIPSTQVIVGIKIPKQLLMLQ